MDAPSCGHHLTLARNQSQELLRPVLRLLVAIKNWSCDQSYVSMTNRTINRTSQLQVVRLSTTGRAIDIFQFNTITRRVARSVMQPPPITAIASHRILWDAIPYLCLRYLLLAPTSSIVDQLFISGADFVGGSVRGFVSVPHWPPVWQISAGHALTQGYVHV